MLHVQSVDSTQLQFQFDHPHMQVDGFYLPRLVIQLRFLEQFQDILQFLIGQFDILAALPNLLLGGVAAGDIIEDAELEV